MMARIENGLSGSSAMVRTNLRNGWIHQRCDMPTSMAKTGRFGRIDTASGAVEEADVVERDDGVVAGLVDVLQAFDFEPEEGAEHDRQEIVEPARRHGEADGDGDQEIRGAEQRKQDRRAEAEFLQHREHERADAP